MKPTVQVSVVEDPNAQGDGFAIVRIIGAGRPPDAPVVLTLERVSSSERFLGPSGWQATPVSLAVDSMNLRDDVLDLLIGPAITTHLKAGTRVHLAIEALDLATELTWPRLVHAASGSRAGLVPPVRHSGPADSRLTPTMQRKQRQAELRAAPRAVPGTKSDSGRRAPRLGRPERPTSRLAATKPVHEPARRVPERHAVRSGSVRRQEPSTVGGPAAETMPWDWDDQSPSETDGSVDARTGGMETAAGSTAGPRRAHHRRVPLPWRIVGINLVVLIVLCVVGYAMVFNGWDPIRMLTGSPAEQVLTDREGRTIQVLPRENTADATAAMRQRSLDALAVAITGPVGEARTALEQGADAGEIHDLARTFQIEGDPVTALSLFDYAAHEGSGAAALAIGRMADPVRFGTEPTAFTRPNAELAIDRYRRALALGEDGAADDLDALHDWLQTAAASGNQEAQNALLLFDTTEL